MYKTPQKTNEPADIVIYRQGQGILLKETSLLAYDTTTQKILEQNVTCMFIMKYLP
ncbi:hypothetical protein [Clostridium sp. AN503]|uniref:hypothetical protein n=1 Tax=Clostridium sp. AN503 TaxID=3160598 RepID=UPI00345AB283